MIRCPKCDSVLFDGTPACPYCQTAIGKNVAAIPYVPSQKAAPVEEAPAPAAAKAKKNVWAILGYILAFLCPPLGFFVSIIGLARVKKCGTGKSLAVAGIIVSILVSLVIADLIWGGFIVKGIDIILNSVLGWFGLGATEAAML